MTGANGFIAAHCVAKLLLSGFSVIGTVRSEAKAQSVLRSHSNHPSLSLIIVEDVTQPGCFDTAIAGCDAVLHLAAPFGYVYSNFETELLIPSINGTLRICEAAQRAKSVKRVVLTSSFASVYDATKGQDPGKTYTEDDWCPLTYEDGKNASAAPIAYRASKVLAEKTAWNFIASNEVAWDLVTLCPGMVFGQLIPGTIGNLKELNTSNGIVWSLFDAKDVPDTKAPSKNTSFHACNVGLISNQSGPPSQALLRHISKHSLRSQPQINVSSLLMESMICMNWRRSCMHLSSPIPRRSESRAER